MLYGPKIRFIAYSIHIVLKISLSLSLPWIVLKIEGCGFRITGLARGVLVS